MNDQVREIVERFKSLPAAAVRNLGEEGTKMSFITPLFQALGWNTVDPNETVMEAAVLEGRADYAFRLHGVTRFYVEAKRASTDIYSEEFAKQAINYAFNKGVAWAVLTNFRQLVVFPAFAQVPRQGVPLRVLDLTFEDYIKPDSGIELLSKEAVTEDRLRERAERTGVRARSVELQKELYNSMRSWRETLITQIAQVMGYSLEDIHQAEEAVQKLLNRLIFLRNCEDREISEENRLRGLLNQWRGNRSRVHLADRLFRIFAHAAQMYDSELFTTDALIDLLLPRLGTTVDDVLGEVLLGLYYPPNSYAEYNFRFIDSDVLGSMYEQYLGHVAQRTRELAATRQQQLSLGITNTTYQIGTNRQRRKEQGIYYTPKWVVDYIVQETLGRWLHEHDKDPDALESLAVLDPACGSGSFLIRAYETLLEHEAARTNQTVDMLPRQEREHILQHNIYGVDLDEQAVEIARLNLLLRMVREEEQLPPLVNNVLQGNSLISGSEADLKPYFADAWEEKHPLNWDATFRQVIEQGGFDVVIGNPPYIRIQTLPELDRDYYRAKYRSAHGSFDIYVLFIEKALALLKDGGRLGFITSGKFLKSEYGRKLIGLLQAEATVEEIVDLSAQQVFGDATTYPIILIARKGKNATQLVYTNVPASEDVVSVEQVAHLRENQAIRAGQDALGEGVWPLRTGRALGLSQRLVQTCIPFGRVATRIFQGLKTGADKVFVLQDCKFADQTIEGFSSALRTRVNLETKYVHALVKGGEIKRYQLKEPQRAVVVPYRDAQLVNAEDLKASAPNTWDYLNANKIALDRREHSRFDNGSWYGHSRPQNLALFLLPKIITPDVAARPEFCLDGKGGIHFSGGGAGGYGILLPPELPMSMILGILNSNMTYWQALRFSGDFRGGYLSWESRFIGRFLIPFVVTEKQTLNPLVNQLQQSVTRMLELHRRLGEKGAAHDAEREALQREIRETDHAIDDLVYDLYGLTAAERRMVEEEVGERREQPSRPYSEFRKELEIEGRL